jgi:hypothetical protein
METAPPSTDPEAFYADSRRAALAAQTQAGTVARDFRVGGRLMRLRFAGDALLPALTAAFAHLAVPVSSDPPELTVHLWDTASSGIPLPHLARWNDCTERGVVRGFHGSPLAVTRLQAAGVCSVLHTERGEALYWAASAADVPGYESGSPFRGLLHAWWRRHHGLLLHAGAVGTPAGGALIVGRGGVGKSTASLACLQAGLHYASDDYCLVVHRDAPVVHSLYCSAKLRVPQLQRFPVLHPLAEVVGEPGEEKALCFLNGLPGYLPARALPLRAILMPRVTGRVDSALTPASAGAALQALAPSALLQLPDAGPAEFAAIRSVVAQAPCYWLEAGTDLTQIPQRVREAIEA